MKRLIETGLMFGNLIEVASPALVERYNRALKHLTGQQTQLTDFHIDISGYSPEIGDELNDHLYLNHAGVNRQFILLTTEQKTAPLLNAKFSNSRDILRRFIEENEPQLFALTARDAVAGELVNSVYEVTTPEHLFDIRKITVEADTAGGTLDNADRLAAKVDRFKTEEDAWFDDVLIAEMITLAQKTGDIARNPVRLKQMSFEQINFWTEHFGGLYVFRGLDHPAVISVGAKEALGKLPIKYVWDLQDRNQIAKFFEFNDLVEPIVKARGVDAAAILRQKMDFVLISAAADAGMDLSGTTRRELRRLARQMPSLPEEFRALSDLVRWAETKADWPRIGSDHPAYFYTLRAADTPDHDLVNMLLCELTPRDFRQTFICHKRLFYARYADWPGAKRQYVVDFLVREYQVDKAGARAALFGHEPDMADDLPPPPPRRERPRDLVARVGPWGAVRRR
ncbi:DUF6638 family protein [Aestuariivita sp.]|jgi:hypothetical protein|uniref:DUF6638 family protein n=1 Tax=Aestuariivita sp. TaxID=1872407 RepID=UPI00216B85DE|nr:DUF6638 family protein [Aestuariivita sp.]MCE8005577.1 hypothetical protein [Aestuariivita sp.]